jgi:hypothetical protein
VPASFAVSRGGCHQPQPRDLPQVLDVVPGHPHPSCERIGHAEVVFHEFGSPPIRTQVIIRFRGVGRSLLGPADFTHSALLIRTAAPVRVVRTAARRHCSDDGVAATAQ